jgi:protein-S-isoprenylcysteine O-methyltransferase Ste14
MSLVFLAHVYAVHLGLWTYGGNALKVLGLPADIWFGGSLLWGSVLFLAFPKVIPWLPSLVVVALNRVLMPSLDPFMAVGPGWFTGVAIVFAVAHLPGLYLARWTARDVRLPQRAFLLAIAYGAFAFFTLPTIVMHATGGDWTPILDRSMPMLSLAAIGLGACFIIGLTAVQMFAIHGGGTPIPLDPTKRLVRTGIYAYLRNPMQACTAAAWCIMGLMLHNIWVALSAAMAVCFVLGMVRWHHRQDLEIRFPEGWAEYRGNVPEWAPRWRPWVRSDAGLSYDPDSAGQRWLVSRLIVAKPTGLRFRETDFAPAYRSPDEIVAYRGWFAFVKALEHINFPCAVFAAAILLIMLPLNRVLSALRYDFEPRRG